MYLDLRCSVQCYIFRAQQVYWKVVTIYFSCDCNFKVVFRFNLKSNVSIFCCCLRFSFTAHSVPFYHSVVTIDANFNKYLPISTVWNASNRVVTEIFLFSHASVNVQFVQYMQNGVDSDFIQQQVFEFSELHGKSLWNQVKRCIEKIPWKSLCVYFSRNVNFTSKSNNSLLQQAKWTQS